MANDIAKLLDSASRQYAARHVERMNEQTRIFAMMFPPSPEGYKAPPPAPPQPYVPSERAKTLLAEIRAATKAGKRSKSLLRIIDNAMDAVEAEAEERFSDY